jgi:hypothetical protein
MDQRVKGFGDDLRRETAYRQQDASRKGLGCLARHRNPPCCDGVLFVMAYCYFRYRITVGRLPQACGEKVWDVST